MISPADATLRRDLAEEAKKILDNRAWRAAILTLRQQWHGELMACRGNKALQDELVAQMRALEAIPARLEGLIVDEQMAQKRRVG